MDDPFDMKEEGTPPSDTPAGQRLIAAAHEAIKLERLAEEMEDQLSQVKAHLNRLKTVELPDIMAECGTSLWKDPDSPFVIEISDFVSGSLPKEEFRRKAALKWLADNDAGDLIKMELAILFDKREHNQARSLAAELHEKGYFVDERETIHAQTLLSHVRERLRNGEEVPFETLGLYAGRTAKIKRQKGKK